MRRILMMVVCLAVIACEQKTAPVAADPPGWSQTNSAAEIALANQAAPGAPAFGFACTRAGSALTLTAGIGQVGIANMAPPFAMVLSGATFPATLVPGADSSPKFSVTAPLSPEMLAALRDSTTARISVNDGYAFAESDVDPGHVFEKFAADCATLTGVVARP